MSLLKESQVILWHDDLPKRAITSTRSCNKFVSVFKIRNKSSWFWDSLLITESSCFCHTLFAYCKNCTPIFFFYRLQTVLKREARGKIASLSSSVLQSAGFFIAVLPRILLENGMPQRSLPYLTWCNPSRRNVMHKLLREGFHRS